MRRLNTYCRLTIFLLLFAFVSLPSYSQNDEEEDYLFEIGGMAGGSYYMGDMNKNSFFKGLNPALGAVFRYTPNLRWAVKTNLTWAQVSGSTEGLENVFPGNAQASFKRSLVDFGGQMEFNFMPYSDRYAYMNAQRFSPYIFVGMGLTLGLGGETMAAFNIPLGVGVKYKLASRLNLDCELSFRKVFSDRVDVTGADNSIMDDPYEISGSLLKNKDWYSLFVVTLTWSFGPKCKTCNNIKYM